MWTTRLFATIVFLVCAFSASAQSEFASKEHRFRFDPPPGWTLVKSDFAIVVFSEAGNEKPLKLGGRNETNREFIARVRQLSKVNRASKTEFRANLIVMRLNEEVMSLKLYADSQRSARKRRSGYKLLGEKPYTLSGEPALLTTIRVESASAPTTITREVAWLRFGKIYTLALTTTADSFKASQSLFDALLGSFRWTN